MSIEDVVKQALLNKGLLSVEESTDENFISVDVDSMIHQCVEELVRFNGLKLEKLLLVRRVFRRVLYHLVRFKAAVSISAIKRKIDPRYRDYVRIILDKCVQQGIVVELESINAKKMYFLSNLCKERVIEYLSADKGDANG